MAWVECPAFDPRRVTRAPEGEFSLGLGNLLGECNHGLFLRREPRRQTGVRLAPGRVPRGCLTRVPGARRAAV